LGAKFFVEGFTTKLVKDTFFNERRIVALHTYQQVRNAEATASDKTGCGCHADGSYGFARS